MGTKTRRNRLLVVFVVALIAGVWSFKAPLDTAWAGSGGNRPGGGDGNNGGDAPQYTLVPLGVGNAFGINDTGQVCGSTWFGSWTGPFAALIHPEDTNGDSIADLWYRDANADGVNDLAIPLDLVPPDGEIAAVGRSINTFGEVAGYSDWPITDTYYTRHAFVYVPEQDTAGNWIWFRDSDGDGKNDLMTDLGFLAAFTYYGGVENYGYADVKAINDVGQILGVSMVAPGEEHGFVITPEIDAEGNRVWTDMVGDVNQLMVDLGPGVVRDINNAGQIVVNDWVITPETDASGNLVYYRDDDEDGVNDLTVQLPPLAPNKDRWAEAMNNLGQIVGSARDKGEKIHAVRWDLVSPGVYTITDLGTVKGEAETHSTDINDAGQVVGHGVTVAVGPGNKSTSRTGFLWQDGTLYPLDQLLGTPDVPDGSHPWSISESGMIALSIYGVDPPEGALLVPVPATP